MGFLAATLSSSSLSKLSSLIVPALGAGTMFGLLVLVVILLFAFSLGRTRVLISLLAIYVAFTLQTVFPFFSQLTKSTPLHDLAVLRVLVFIALYVLVFLILNASILKSRFNLGEAAFVSVVVMGVVQLCFIVSIILNLAPSFYGIESRLPSALIPYLATRQALFAWSVIPIILALFSKRHK